MHLVTYTPLSSPGAAPRIGALVPGGAHVLDLARAVDPDSSAPPPSAWYDLDGDWLPSALTYARAHLAAFAAGSAAPRAGALIAAGTVRLLAPVPRPGKIICIGLNYRDHAAESKMEVPTSPVTFSKYVTSVQHPDGPVRLPAVSQKVDYEAEMAFVIGRRAKHVAREQAFDHVLGYMNFNDVSARDLQFADGQWQRGKSCDTFAPMGPAIVTVDEVPDPHNLRIQLRLNGQTMQDSTTAQLVFGVDALIAFLSETVTLEPGDVVATGTPPGVGFARKPPVYLKDGDVMEVEVERLGVLRNPVTREAS
jgi:2-keto-4-pentenoate hydratase/2-oxohepta-3-ene-1,7-dioic acid hydratase in catechol pathway